MRALIRFWQSKLKSDRWLMSAESREMIEETVRCLRELEKLQRLTRVEREAEIVRTVKQLGEANALQPKR
jgi:hypothetical protein